MFNEDTARVYSELLCWKSRTN